MSEATKKLALDTAACLMWCENLGDVHDVIDALTNIADAPPLEGDFLEGWTETDTDRMDEHSLWKRGDYTPRDGGTEG